MKTGEVARAAGSLLYSGANRVKGAAMNERTVDHTAGQQQDQAKTTFACNMLALDVEQRIRHETQVRSLRDWQLEIRELPNGFAFRFSNEAKMIHELAEFIANERLCCPFFDFELKLEREGGSLWMSITGREGVKPFIRMEFGF